MDGWDGHGDRSTAGLGGRFRAGSVGLPLATVDPFLSHPRFADYALVEIEGGAASVELRRVALHAEAVERAAAESGMPDARQWAALLGRRIIRHNAEAIQAPC